MKLFERLNDFKNCYMFIKWVGGSEYVKLINVGEDYIEFNVIDIETMEYQETIIMRKSLLIEVALGGSDVARILAELSCNLPAYNKE